MRVFDASGAIIETGGNRRAAAIGVLRVDHPDIFEFIDAKRQEGVLTQFNISVALTYKFLAAVKADADFDLVFGGRVYRTVKAKDIWSKLVSSGYNFNDPGILMIDEVNKYNNGYYLYEIETTNPCGEIPLPPYGVCDLGNINLTKYVKEPFAICTEGKELISNFDIAAYQKDIKTAVRFLDNVLDVSEYPYDEIRDRAQGDRRIGLNGVAGLGSALAMLRLPYDTAAGRDKAEILQKICTAAAYEASIELAKEKGSFPNFDKEKYLEAPFIKTLPEYIQEGIAKYGIRNLAILTIPPVGTGSILAGNISNGLEPIFALEYNRMVRQPDQTSKQEAVEDYAWKLFKKTEEFNPAVIPPDFFKTSRDISPKAHIDMQACLQKHIDGSISKTVNMPESTTIKAYEEALWYAIESGCKGFTSFREGTREGVLSTKEEGKKPAEVKPHEKIKAAEPKKKRPRKLIGSTYKVADDKGNLYITINDIEEKGKTRPFEIFINSNGANSDNAVFYKAMGKMMSAVMRRTDACRFLVTDLQGIHGAQGFFSDGRYNQSQPQMIGNILEEHYRSLDPESAKEIKYLKCPECGEHTYLKEGGCGKCLSCGFSSCG
jgi:ribonucleoside-diphosphate reductase alpha chain